jgi:uncharacterized protein YacL
MIRKNQNNEVDTVIAGNIIMIIGLLILLSAPIISYLSYTPGELTGYEDKTTRMPDYISPVIFVILGFFIAVIGCAVFFRNLVNSTIDGLIRRFNK